MSGELLYWVANWNLSRAQAALLLGNKVVEVADSIGSTSHNLTRSDLHHFGRYVTGGQGIEWTAGDSAAFPPGTYFIDIDQSNSNQPHLPAWSFDPINPSAKARYLAKDVESGASSIAAAMSAARIVIDADEDYVIYVDQAMLNSVEESAARNKLPRGKIIGYQYASPTSNPNTLLPGTDMTLKEANADLSVFDASYFAPLPHPAPKPPPAPPKRAWHAIVTFDRESEGWAVHAGTSAPDAPGKHATVTFDEGTDGWSIKPGIVS